MKTQKHKIYLRESKPGFNEYRNMVPEFRPYVMFTNADNYKTKVVNTDRLGFRKVFFKKKLYGIDDLKKVKRINILTGSSTAFGMGSEDDKSTIQSFLSSMGKLCFSMGIRGGTSQQELISFLKFKFLFPKIDNIIILSGNNDINHLASLDNSFYYRDYGGFSGGQAHTFHAFIQANSFDKKKWVTGKNNLFFYLNNLSAKSNILKFILANFFSFFKKSKLQKKTQKNILNSYEKMKNLKLLIENDIHTWSIIQKQMNVRIIYLFQPTILWSNRNCTDYEKQIIKFEKRRIKNYFDNDFTSKTIYKNFRNFTQSVCKKNLIKFYDINTMLKKTDDKKDFFIDYSHLTAYGNYFIANLIKKIIK